MNRNTVAAMTATAMLATGCTSAELQLPAPAPEIQLGALPAALPPLVRTMMANSVEIQGVLPPKKLKHKSVDMVEFAQGVWLGPDVVATAGHAVIDGKGNAIASLTAACGNLTVRTPTDVPTAHSHGHNLYGTALPLQAYKASRGPAGNALQSPDLALLRVRPSRQVKARRPVTLAPAGPMPGDDLYTINYEVTANTQERSPAEAVLSENALRRGFSQPAIFGMIALSHQTNQLLEAVDTQRSYGVSPEDQSREGASGSPVYNRQGQLVGLIVQEFENLTAEQLTGKTGLRFKGKTSGKFNEVLIQPVTPKLVREFSDGLPANSNCQP